MLNSYDDVADGLLLDVRETIISDLKFVGADSALGRALERILSSVDHNSNGGGGSFNNFIN